MNEKERQQTSAQADGSATGAPGNRDWAAIFDWDGVLVNSAAAHLESWRRLAREEGKPLPPDFFLPSFGKKNDWVIPHLLHWTEDPAEIRRISERKEELYRAIVAERGIDLYPGGMALCASLAERSVPMAIASSTARANIELTLHQANLRHRFRTVISAEDVHRGKPDPEVFLLAARRLGFPPERCVVFEDAPVGVEAAKRAGMRAVAVTTTNPAEALQLADRTLPDLGMATPERIAQWFFS
ncbi:Glycoprotease [Methylacidimicrobium sp. AP8]|uniref:HAD family hydrolase n=1 Tax=Methylacidimicrobium sp. AP8 TaxID=2730359 RepID=UPI0018BFE0AA|nr:HAD family phosphatase [Methylacidimicrobium sp. AP8]CAB4243763.1 Glycoprotease [Methylacidimicrobium sp. AP8]